MGAAATPGCRSVGTGPPTSENFMKVRGKALSALLVGSALAFILLVVSLNVLSHKNRYRVREEIEKSLGRAFTLDELELNLWGGPGLSAKNLRVAEDPRFAATPFLQANRLKISLRWLPLLFGRIEIKKIVLDDPEIQIIKNEAGSLNISALPGPEKKGRNLRFPPSRISVSNGRLDYIDRSSKRAVEFRIRNLDADLTGSVVSRTVKVKLAAGLFDAQRQNVRVQGLIGPLRRQTHWMQQPLDIRLAMESILVPQATRAFPLLSETAISYLDITGPLALEARLTGTLEQPRLRDLALSGPFFGSTTNNTTLRGELDFSKSGSWRDGAILGKIAIDPVSLDHLKKIPLFRESVPAQLSSQGPWSVAGELQGSFQNLKIRARIQAGESEIRYGKWLKKDKGIPAGLDLKMTRQKDHLAFEDSTLTIHNLKLKFFGSLAEMPERRLMLRLRSEAADLSGWDRILLPLSAYTARGSLWWDLSIRKKFGPKDGELDIRGILNLAEAQAKDKKTGRAIEKVSARISFQGKEARLENAFLRLGSSNVSLEALADLSQPTLRYTLSSPRLKLSDLTGAPALQAGELQGLRSTGALYLSNGSLVVNGNVSSPEGILQDIRYRDLRGQISWSPKGASFKDLSFRALGGTFRASGGWMAQAGSQRVALDSAIEAVDLKNLLAQKFPDFKGKMEGRLNLKAMLRGEGKNAIRPQENLVGEGETQVQGGSLKGFNLLAEILSKGGRSAAISKLLPSRIPDRYRDLFQKPDTVFDTFRATFRLSKGRIFSDDLFLATPDYSIAGQGWIALDKTTKWDGTLVLSRHLTQELMQEHKNIRYLLDRQGRLSVPFRVEGTLPHVQAKPYVEGLAETLQRGLLRKGLERPLEKEKKRERQDWIQKGLEQLFGK